MCSSDLLFTNLDPKYGQMDDAALHGLARAKFGDRAAQAVDAYRQHRPDYTTPGMLASAILTDESFRSGAIRLAEARAANGHPTWMHWFTWETPQFGGLLKSCHALDIPFVFHNLDRNGVDAFTGNGPDREAVADFFSAAVAGFAHHGDPGWRPYDLDSRSTMQIDVRSRLIDDPEPTLRALWSALD